MTGIIHQTLFEYETKGMGSHGTENKGYDLDHGVRLADLGVRHSNHSLDEFLDMLSKGRPAC